MGVCVSEIEMLKCCARGSSCKAGLTKDKTTVYL